MKTRFKTKQEFQRQYGDDWRSMAYWDKNMDHLFGLPFCPELNTHNPYPQLNDGYKHWYIYIFHLTTDPHPYEGKHFAIKVEGRKQAKKVRERLIVMGFKDNKSWNDTNIGKNIYNHFIVYPDNSFTIHTHTRYCDTILTYDQFMEGYWPEEEDAFAKKYMGKQPEPAEELTAQQRYIAALEYHVGDEDFIHTLRLAAGLDSSRPVSKNQVTINQYKNHTNPHGIDW